MKAERRHELRENDLIHALESARDYMNENGGRIAVAVIAVVAVVLAVSFGLRSRAAAFEDIWRQKNELRFDDPTVARKSLEQLAVLTNRSSDDAFITASLIEQGRQALRWAVAVPFPPDAELNEMAREAFDDLRRRFPANPMAVGLSGLGLATVEENAFVLDRDRARKARAEELLNSVAQNPALAGMPFPKMAVDRLATLDAVFTEVIYVPPPVPDDLLEPTMDVPAELAPVDSVDSLDSAEPPATDTP